MEARPEETVTRLAADSTRTGIGKPSGSASNTWRMLSLLLPLPTPRNRIIASVPLPLAGAWGGMRATA